MKRFSRSSAIICSVLLLMAGCCPKPKSTVYYGPTLVMDDVVSRVNANNNLIPTLWANVDFSAAMVEGGKRQSVSGDGTLMFRRPGDLRMDGSHAIAGALFQIGANAEEYWLATPMQKRAYWGYHKNAGKPCVQDLPIRPDLLVEVLGISTFNTNFLDRPVPVMRFNHDESAYMFVWHDRLATRWAAQKEIWYDLNDFTPRRVILFDENGRTLLRADLSEPRPVEVPELPKEKWPKVATKYSLQFPVSQASMKLELSGLKLRERNKVKAFVPNAATFVLPESQWEDDGLKVSQVDRNCRD